MSRNNCASKSSGVKCGLLEKCVHYMRCALFIHMMCGIYACLVCSPIADDIWSEKFENQSTARNLFAEGRSARVLNFFPIPVEEECNANDGRRKGVCMNPYECRMQGGASKGTCALGFGVCCTFTATCDQDVYNNITYFINPSFPDLNRDIGKCSVKIKKIDPDIAQFRLDFIHFNLGQPNRRNGVCEEDVFSLSGGVTKELSLCGINSGQHVLFDVEDVDEPIVISMNLSKKAVSRLWEIKVVQVPFVQKAPEGCLQYHTGLKGVIQTMNYAENGRHLANQDYNICIRKEEGMCSIAYEPCDENSFKIGNIKPHVQYFNIDYNVSNTIINEIPDAASNEPMPEATQIAGQEEVLNDVGSGAGGIDDDLQPRMSEICTNRIILPCDNDDFLLATGMPTGSQNGYCSLAHCGSSLCPNGERPCRVESNVTPFTVGVQFGASGREESPEDNIGMCLTYEQQPCSV